MEKIINLLINNWTKGVDTYTHNGSTWLIFSESKQWVIELTESKTLWYNYNFFKELFSLTSMDVVDNQHYITKWVEDNIINKVKDTILERNITEGEVDDIIQDGVKKTSSHVMLFQSMKVEDTIQNGVKETITSENRSRLTAENIIENGVRHTIYPTEKPIFVVEDAIENGVRHTEIGWHQCNNIDDAIEKGVKETNLHKGVRPSAVEVTIQNGVTRENSSPFIPSWVLVEDAIKHGVKHTEYGDWLDGDERLDDIVENRVKETSLKRGTRPFTVNDTIKNGVKETKTPGKDGDIMSTVEWMNENNSSSYTKMIDDVIENGVKETFDTEFMPKAIVEDIIQNGVKETKVCHYTDPKTNIIHVRWPDKIVDVIQNGTKNPSV
jgi:tartrate dehydratase alpha subunit/fumarate hydratase class I-like protein